MSATSLNCPNCGAPLTGVAGQTSVVCDHCGSLIALKPSPAPPAPEPNTASDTLEPRYDYGPQPSQRPAPSGLTSITLGPADASHVIQLLREHQELEAIQFYQSKVGGTLGEAKDAITAIQAGLRDASAPVNPSAAPAGQGWRVANTAPEGLEPQLYPNRVRGPEQVSGRPRRRSGSGLGGCTAVGLSILAILMCLFGGCGVYLQTKAIYGCSMREIKSVLAKEEIFQPPINGGYLVFASGYKEGGNLKSWHLDAFYYAPVWGSNGWGVVRAHITADETGWNNVSAMLYKVGKQQQLLSAQKINCAQ